MNYFWIFPKKNILGYPHFRNPPYVCAKTRRACVTLEVSREAWSSAVLFGSGSWGDQCSNRLEASKVMLIGYQRGFFISIYSYNIYIYIFIYIYILVILMMHMYMDILFGDHHPTGKENTTALMFFLRTFGGVPRKVHHHICFGANLQQKHTKTTSGVHWVWDSSRYS